MTATATEPTARATKPGFTDSAGRRWTMEISIGDLDDLATAGLDVEKVSEDLSLLAALASSARAFAKILWALVGQQVEQAGVTPADFAKALKGDALAEAFVAIRDALILFTPWPKATKERMIKAMTEAAERVGVKATTSDPSPAG